MAEKEVLVLRMLMDNIRGLYGSELVHKSGGQLGRGTVYTLLERLVEKGYIREVEDPPTAALQLKRTRHVITGNGQRAFRDWAGRMGVVVKRGAFSRG
jgi:DNA-binding PadR family transcriptional regulator